MNYEHQNSLLESEVPLNPKGCPRRLYQNMHILAHKYDLGCAVPLLAAFSTVSLHRHG